MEILLETTLDTLALISLPDFDFYMGWNQPFVWEFNDSAKSFLFDRFEEELEHFPFFLPQRKVRIEQLKESLVAPYTDSYFFVDSHQLCFFSYPTLKIHGCLKKPAILCPSPLRRCDRLINLLGIGAILCAWLIMALINQYSCLFINYISIRSIRSLRHE